MEPKQLDLAIRIVAVFADALASAPTMSLRAAGEIDAGMAPSLHDAERNSPSVAYLEKHAYDLPFLDAKSWKHYLPLLLAVAVSNAEAAPNAVDGLLSSLRPPDRQPPRLASLSAEQEQVLVAVLEFLAFSENSSHSDAACTALEEWWGESPLYRG